VATGLVGDTYCLVRLKRREARERVKVRGEKKRKNIYYIIALT